VGSANTVKAIGEHGGLLPGEFKLLELNPISSVSEEEENPGLSLNIP